MRLVAALAALLLAGCATAPGVLSAPSAALMAECPKPVVELRTNEGIAQGLKDYAEALKLCNIDKRKLREFYDVRLP